MLERWYSLLPVPLQNAACSWQGWRIAKRRYNAQFHELLAAYEARANWNSEQFAAYRDERVAEFVLHCGAHVPYYRRLFAQLGLDPGKCAGLADLSLLPILTKAQVQENPRDFISEVIPKHQQRWVHTSGTTGAGLRFPVTDEATRHQYAVWWRYRRWHGIALDTWCAYFGGRSVVPNSQVKPPFWRTNKPGRQILFSAYHMTPGNLDTYIAELNRTQVPWLHGYPSTLALLAGHLLETGQHLRHSVKWITIGAENLLPQQIRLIEAAFGVAPLQHYGMMEGAANISQRPDGQLYVDEDYAAVEFIPHENGSSYRIVGTNFTNPAFPLLRYEIGDTANLAAENETLDAPYPGRRVIALDGRNEDYVVLHNGAKVGRLDHIFKDMTSVREAQIVQHRAGELSVRLVKAANFNPADEQILRREFATRLGEQTKIEIEYVDSIPRTKSGKLRFVISTMSASRLVSDSPTSDGTGE